MQRTLATLLVLTLLAGCSSLGLDHPRKGTLIPAGTLKLMPRYSVAYMDLIMIAGMIGLMYQIVDPQAPAWEIIETRLPDNRVLYSLRMQRVFNGGEGEARQVLARRATELAREQGMASYSIERYTESIDSRLFLPHRTAEAEVRMVPRTPAPVPGPFALR